MSKTAVIPDYVECDGVRVPANWTIPELLAALEKRNVRFSNESDIQAAFEVFHASKSMLQEQIEGLAQHKAELESKTKKLAVTLKNMNKRVKCPSCGANYIFPDE